MSRLPKVRPSKAGGRLALPVPGRNSIVGRDPVPTKPKAFRRGKVGFPPRYATEALRFPKNHAWNSKDRTQAIFTEPCRIDKPLSDGSLLGETLIDYSIIRYVFEKRIVPKWGYISIY